MDPKIIIIGAGAAGIAAASRLLQKGLKNVLILEAKDRIGGRIHTVPFSESVIDLGAQWCHGEDDNVVYNLASSHNLLESSKNINDKSKHIFVNADGEVLSEQETVEVLKIYYKILDDGDEAYHKPGTSFGEFFTKQFYKEIENNVLINKQRAEEIINWMHKYENSIECSDTWYDVSATRLKEYKTCEGDPLLNWKNNGYKKVFDLLTKNFPDPTKRLPVYEKILYNKEISLIDYNLENEVKVTTTDGSIYKASNIIFTPSLGVLKEQHEKIFKPSLSDSKIRAIKGFNIGVADKIFLEFPHRWWPKDTGGICLMWSKKQKKEFLETHSKDRHWLCEVFKLFTVDFQPRLLNIFLVGPEARHVETLSDDEVLNEFHFILKKFLGHIYDIPRPQNLIRSKWYSDKHFRGSYSFRSLETEVLNVHSKDLYNPITKNNNKPVILFAGEATHEHYFSTVHGAIETGFREADRLINYYKNLKPKL